MPSKYPFQSNMLNESKLRDWLTKVLYPKDYRAAGSQKSRAKKRLAARIHYARSQNLISKPQSGLIDARSFFEWACQQKGWEALLTVEGLPKNATVYVKAPPTVRSALGDVSAVPLPENKADLKAAVLDLHQQNQILSQRITKLEQENSELKHQLKTKKEREARASEYGKRPEA